MTQAYIRLDLFFKIVNMYKYMRDTKQHSELFWNVNNGTRNIKSPQFSFQILLTNI